MSDRGAVLLTYFEFQAAGAKLTQIPTISDSRIDFDIDAIAGVEIRVNRRDALVIALARFVIQRIDAVRENDDRVFNEMQGVLHTIGPSSSARTRLAEVPVCSGRQACGAREQGSLRAGDDAAACLAIAVGRVAAAHLAEVGGVTEQARRFADDACGVGADNLDDAGSDGLGALGDLSLIHI